eukprot:CAMPEP_0185162462 /NCGR_PEP_ID=MMETSP1139-20130426/6520_1 /TAXON_ID=298111 /ORGANISM="Pavlova sp., Strain CCMP459" /LENGTH=106 /DNA_ID=CAMNT_0027727791 /DNA_START=443 /DNA_END=763 /DNA_ORIENTATION=+
MRTMVVPKKRLRMPHWPQNHSSAARTVSMLAPVEEMVSTTLVGPKMPPVQQTPSHPFVLTTANPPTMFAVRFWEPRSIHTQPGSATQSSQLPSVPGWQLHTSWTTV